MPKILTYSELKNYNRDNLNESTEIMKKARYSSVNFSQSDKNVFLSYSSKDSELLPGIVKLLEKHGGDPYIDKGDETLPEKPSVETAEILKDSINKCKNFILFVTTNSIESKWIPWELGLGDGTKKNNDIAIFPTGEKSYETTWTEQEYLGLYRKIMFGKLEGYEKEVWMVHNNQNNTATELSKWLK